MKAFYSPSQQYFPPAHAGDREAAMDSSEDLARMNHAKLAKKPSKFCSRFQQNRNTKLDRGLEGASSVL